MINIIVVKHDDKNYTAFGKREGATLSSTIHLEEPESKRQIEKILSVRFGSQIVKARTDGVNIKKSTGKGIYNFQWVDFESVENWINKPLDLPAAPVVKKAKPKLYEVQINPNGGLTLIKHEKELLDEDEAKIRLFEAAVNS